ncbi:lipopolysaccharide biosynthesis protein RfbH [Alcanivorax sp.]|uniref:lipopolysaccharide biosynthesis protein RfbH n=1 Tax=Alcanivorax sp. TaxID=1872427 RepID=UPI00258B029A|nr:lipopolysaccharide biosynthesis protein RfbH [Alcanivorax sp.]
MDELRQQILGLVEKYGALKFQHTDFEEGASAVPPSGKVLGAMELQYMVDACLDGWLTTGRFNEAFEKCLADFLGVRHVLTVNSGSSANLLAFAALTSPKLGNRALRPGDEVITVAAGFPTTVNPILLYGCIPVFVDVDIPTYNIDVDKIEEALSEKTRAIVLAHTLGNPFDVARVKEIAEKYDLWLLEDCCDALGSTYDGKLVGTFGDIGTLSFYPAHHITMGEGGAVFTNNGRLKLILESIRDWGRDCFCDPGKDNTCCKRFAWKLGELPEGYDHKYIYSHLGYNLKITDMQAACGLAQLERLESFIQARKENFSYLKSALKPLEEFFILPEATRNSDPAWFGFPITIREEAPFSRLELLHFLDERKIGTRLLFAGNLIRQPYFQGRKYRVSSNLANTDRVMNQTFWLGVFPGLRKEMLDYVADSLTSFCRESDEGEGNAYSRLL